MSRAARLEAQPQRAAAASVEEIEIKLLLEGVALRYGCDLRDYAPAPLMRNIGLGMAGEGVTTISTESCSATSDGRLTTWSQMDPSMNFT